MRWFREFSDSPNGTRRFYHSQKPTSMFGLGYFIFFDLSNAMGTSTTYNVTIHVIQIIVPYLYNYTQQQIEASLQLWNMWVYHCLGYCDCSWVHVLKCTSPNTRKTSARDQRISENSFFAYKKNDFLPTPPPGVGGCLKNSWT